MSTIETYRTNYDARLFPLKPRVNHDPKSKTPLRRNWRMKDYSESVLLDYWKNGHGIGWALSPGDLVIDVDAPTPERPEKRGLESLKKLEAILGADLRSATSSVVAPSGGIHLYFTKPEAVRIRKTLPEFPDIEFISEGGYVVIAGSLHWQGGSYRFADKSDELDFNRAAVPGSLLGLLERSDVADSDPDNFEGISAPLLKTLLDELDPTSYRANDQWFPLLCASHHATGGSADGRDVFVDWSTSDPHYAGEAERIAARWSSLKIRNGSITIGTLFDELITQGRGDIVKLVQISQDFDVVTAEDKKRKPRIEYGIDEKRVNDQVVEALTNSKSIFQRGGSLVEVKIGGERPAITSYTAINLCEVASSVCSLLNYKKDKWVPMRIPERVGRQIIGRGFWLGIPLLRFVSDCPVMVAGGRILTGGFDLLSGVYIYGDSFPSIPAKPTFDDAKIALAQLLGVVSDFPFADPSHRSNYLAAVLTLLARGAIDGPTPLFLVDGNQAGVGKSLLVDTVATIAFGNKVERALCPPNEEELAKTLFSVAIKAGPLFLFDNVKSGSYFGSPTLDAVLTAGKLTGRVLGKSEIRDLPVDTVFFATGNRIQLSRDSDIVRRIAFIALEYKGENPESRKGFAHGADGTFLEWVQGKRKELVAAGLTILKAFVESGERPPITPWGSFGQWSDLIRAAIVWLGEPDPIDARASLLERDSDLSELQIVIEGLDRLLEGKDMTAGAIFDSLSDRVGFDGSDPDGVFAATLEALVPSHLKDPKKALGIRLKSRFSNRPAGGKWVRSRLESHFKQLVYFVESVD